MPRRATEPSDPIGSRRLVWFDYWLETPHDELDTFATAAIAVLFKHMNRDGWCKVGTRRVAQLMRCSRPTAEHRLRLLADIGVVYAGKRNNAVTFHAAAFPEEHPLHLDWQTTLASCPWTRPQQRRATGQSHGCNWPTSALQLAKDFGTNPGTRVTGGTDAAPQAAPAVPEPTDEAELKHPRIPEESLYDYVIRVAQCDRDHGCEQCDPERKAS
jgi:hypothetical protein